MENQRILGSVLSAAAMLSFIAIIIALAPPSSTGGVTTYRELPLYGGVQDRPDRGVQYLTIDPGLCYLYVTRPATFFAKVDRLCQENNHGRQKNEAMCRRQADLDAQGKCITGPWRPGTLTGRVTGMIPVDPLSCAELAANYDAVVQQTLDVFESPQQTIAMVNPCSGGAGVATRSVAAPEGPLREYARVAFPTGDVTGSVAGEDAEGDVRYVHCADGSARVVVSGVAVCNTMD